MSNPTIPVDEAAAARFLGGKRFALIGASDNPKNFAVTIHRELSAHGYELVPVNPAAAEVWQQPCYPTIADVPGDLDGAIVMVPADAAKHVVAECISAGITDIWLFRGVGSAGATSPEAAEMCARAGVNLVNGACPLMFVDHAGWIHRLHHAIRVARGGIAHSAKLC